MASHTPSPPDLAGRGPDARSGFAGWLPAIAWAALLFVLSAIPGPKFPKVGFANADKVVHICLYAPLGAGFLLALLRAPGRRLGLAVAWAIGLATTYGVLDELHQLFVPGRSSDWHDVVADLVGAGIGASALAFHLRRKARSPRSSS